MINIYDKNVNIIHHINDVDIDLKQIKISIKNMKNIQCYRSCLAYFSFFIGIMLHITSYQLILWNYQIQPSWLMVILIYWIIILPNRFGIGTGFFLGLIVDIISGCTLGIHALSWSVLSYIISKKIYFFYYILLWKQSIIIMFLSVINQSIKLLIKTIITTVLCIPEIFWNSILDGGLWLIINIVMRKYISLNKRKSVFFWK